MLEFLNLLCGLSNQVNNPSLRPVHMKVKEPNVFDGLDLQKLKAFIVSLQLNFNDRLNAFCTDTAKVNYAISFLSGVALDWFEPDILHPNHTNPPAWAYSYAAFLLKLWTNFSPFDAVRDAEDELKNLRMHDGDLIMKYIVCFNQHAAVIGYGDNSLCHAFYRGLCTQIKDDMAHHGEPNNLHDMRNLAQELDARYWTRKTEIAHENHDKPSSSSSSSSSKPKGSGSNSNSSYNSTVPKSSNSGSVGSASSTPSSSGATKKPYADKLGKDGKLTPEEKEHHHMNNLCMFCGSKHKTEDCNKCKAVASTHGHAAEVSEPPISTDLALSESEK